MGKHLLSLHVPTIYNPGILVVEDISVYDSILPVSCETLQIVYPGGSRAVQISVNQGFRSILNACTLGYTISTACTTSCPEIPDGIYNIQYSVSPNDKVFVEYNHLRTTSALNRWNNMLCRLDMKACLPGKEEEYQLQQLYMIKGFIDSAKAAVEVCHRNENGINLLRYAEHLMDKMSFKNPLC
jgi:hypothetical protein